MTEVRLIIFVLVEYLTLLCVVLFFPSFVPSPSPSHPTFFFSNYFDGSSPAYSPPFFQRFNKSSCFVYGFRVYILKSWWELEVILTIGIFFKQIYTFL